MYQEMFNFVNAKLEESSSLPQARSGKVFPFRSRYEHTKRVFVWSKRLLQHETADAKKVLTAAVFHDVGYCVSKADHGAHSAVICAEYLKEQGYDDAFVWGVCELVANHSNKSLPTEELAPELRVLMDADWLDELGAIAVLWDVMDEGRQENCSYNRTYERLRTMLSGIEKHCGKQKTETGIRWYAEKIEFVRSFTENLRFELGIDEEI